VDLDGPRFEIGHRLVQVTDVDSEVLH
jgi:hypothetical protein